MVEQTSIKDQLYKSILADIVQGIYPVNAVLNERMLVEKYQVSKTPVREALVQLCCEGILKNIPRFGYQLTPITPKEICDAQELRIVLEVAALEKSIQQITPEQIQMLEEYMSPMHWAEPRAVMEHWARNMNFHLLLCSLCDNTFLYNSLNDVLKFCYRSAPQYFQKTWEHTQLTDPRNHLMLIEHLKNKDLPRARQVLIDDISSMKEEILKF